MCVWEDRAVGDPEQEVAAAQGPRGAGGSVVKDLTSLLSASPSSSRSRPREWARVAARGGGCLREELGRGQHGSLPCLCLQVGLQAEAPHRPQLLHGLEASGSAGVTSWQAALSPCPTVLA